MSTDRNVAPDRYIFGPYEILDTLGKGGMGVVYRAHDRNLHRDVALKILRDDLRAESRVLARFRREAETFAKLDHPNIVHVFSVGAVDSIPYIAMQYIEGETLANRLRRVGPLPWKEALQIGLGIAQALQGAHAAQVIHRDIKPGNILLGDDGGIHVTDFGIAKVLNATTQLTIDGSRLGTPQYMCPERCKNEKITPSSDLYSLGVVLFQAITGKLPYSARTSVELIEKITAQAPARASSLVERLPESVDRLLAWLLEKNPSRRPAHAQALCEAIERVLAGMPLDGAAEERHQLFEGYRRGLPRAARTTQGSTPTPDPNPRASRLWMAAARKKWFKMPAWLRVGVALLSLLALVGAALTPVAVQFLRPRVMLERLSDAQSVARWELPGAFVSFSRENELTQIGSLNTPGLRIKKIVPGLAPATLLVELTHDADAGLVGVIEINALTGDTHSVMPLAPVPASVALVGAIPNASGLSDLFLTNNRDARVWNPSRSLPRGVDVVLGNVAFNGPASAVSLPYWTGTSWAVAAAVTRGGFHDWQVCSYGGDLRGEDALLSPTGAPIESVAISDDGRRILVLRNSSSGELWQTEQGAPPSLIDEGDLGLTQRAIEPRGDRMAYARNNEVIVRRGKTLEATWPGSEPQWLAQGGQILFLANDALQRTQLFRMDPVRPLEPIQLTHLETGIGGGLSLAQDGSHAAVSMPDGKRFVLVYIAGT